ncbi:Hsp70 family protein [Actinomadura nitritigenes]|uniref:Hsp70 family protein n=1 Tax=Actinomadura nitritigenes TaxID=134602 RepID=UPI003D8CCCDB
MKRPVLAIDFGGSFVMGASRVDDLDDVVSGPVPSLVFVGPDGRLTTGETAAQLAEAFPDRVVRDLRQVLVAKESVRVADRDVPAAALAAAPLRQIMLEAARRREVERFDRAVLTYPARWGSRESAALARAASEAGLPRPWFVTEAEAVAAFHDPGPGDAVAVYDLGGRSLDVTVLRRTAAGLEILGRPGGHDRFGGDDLDQALYRIVAERAGRLDAAAWDGLTRRRNGPELVRREVVEARHALSEHGTASLRLDGFTEAVTVTRAEFEDATGQMLRWSVDELAAAVERAGLSPDDLAAVHLAGGASRMPKIAELVAERLGRAPTTAADPKAVFALGALLAYARDARNTASGAGGPLAPVAQATAPAVPAVPTVPTAAGLGLVAGHAASAPGRRAGPRLKPPHLLALAMIPVTAAVVAASFFVRAHLASSEDTGSSPVATTVPPVPDASPTAPPPSPAVSVTDSPSPPESSSPPEESPTPADAGGIKEGTYSVSLTGTVSGQTFRRTAQLQVMPTVTRVGTTNGVNPIEVCLRSGFPAGTPEVGAIWFGTNTACFPERGAQLDMTTVEMSGDTVTVRPDARIAATGLNQFTASGNYIYACLYQPVSGTMTVSFSGGSPSGELDINGYSGPCQAVGTNTAYTARFTG